MFGNGAAFFFKREQHRILHFRFFLAIGGAIYMISFTKVVHMVMALSLTFISLAGLYVILNAEFIAFVQVLIYSGAITILMIFGIMMTRHQGEEQKPKRPAHNILTAVGALGLLGILFYAIQKSSLPSGEYVPVEKNTMEIGQRLFNEYAIPFEIMSVLLTVAFIGAIVIAKREEE